MEQQVVVIEGKGLCIGYKAGKSVKQVHAGLDFKLRRGELTCLLGANGAGKSTLLRTLAAAQPPLGVNWTCWASLLRFIPKGNVRVP